MAPPLCIDAPYNFVPLADWVHIPDWAGRVSHDLPFRDGLSGHLDLTITAHTPILVGREQQSATPHAPGEVHPYQLPDGRYALPGTALKGMIRAVVEIASFSRMAMVDDVRYGLRDISGGSVSAAYTARVRNQVRTGFMEIGSDGLPRVIPCEMVRLSHRDLEDWLKVKKPIFPPDRSIAKKYQQWEKVCKDKSIDPTILKFSPSDGQATCLNDTGASDEGVPVFTGQISDSTKPKGKQRDFVFYNEDQGKAFALTQKEWSDFLFVHGDQATKDAAGMSWPGYWKNRYWNGERIPVFYVRDTQKSRIGLAYMPRLAGDFSITEMISHTHPEHLNGQGKGPWDFTENLFGTVGSEPDVCLKGRVIIHHAVASNATKPIRSEPTILNGPKASYFPNYIVQNIDREGWRLRGKSYATCLGTVENPQPEVRGWKRYPARPNAKVQALSDEQKSNRKVQIILNPLCAGTTFSTRVVFHNLKWEELGALCWAITWGGNFDLRHSLGMGKPFGFGQITIKISECVLRPNRNDVVAPNWEECRDAFILHMEESAKKMGKRWRDSPQITTLLGMANHQNAARFKGKLHSLNLEPKKKINEFVDAKQASLVLSDYPVTEHPPTWAEQEVAREEATKREADAQAERERQEQEQAKKAQDLAAFSALPEELKQIANIEQKFNAFIALNDHQQRQQREALVSDLNKLAEAAKTWGNSSYRSDACSLLERIYEAIGWADPGKKGDKRKKQEDKRRGMIEEIRRGI